MQVVKESDDEDAGPGSDCDVELTAAAKALLSSDEDVVNRLDRYFRRY